MAGDAILLAACNHVLARAEWAQRRLAGYAGRRARLLVPPWALEFSIAPSGFLEALPGADESRAAAPDDVEIALPGDAWLKLVEGQAGIMRSARITGSADFAEALGFVMSRLRWDAEEDLSRWIGDIAAHRLAGLAAALFAWQKQAARRLAENIAEYLTEESSLLVPSDPTSRFVAEVDRLRDDVARLEKRLQRLA